MFKCVMFLFVLPLVAAMQEDQGVFVKKIVVSKPFFAQKDCLLIRLDRAKYRVEKEEALLRVARVEYKEAVAAKLEIEKEAVLFDRAVQLMQANNEMLKKKIWLCHKQSVYDIARRAREKAKDDLREYFAAERDRAKCARVFSKPTKQFFSQLTTNCARLTQR